MTGNSYARSRWIGIWVRLAFTAMLFGLAARLLGLYWLGHQLTDVALICEIAAWIVLNRHARSLEQEIARYRPIGKVNDHDIWMTTERGG